MTIPNADRCIANTLVYEGGYGRNSKDRGDWTSGQIGVGRLSGTAYGIAAMTLKDRGIDPNIDMSKMTKAEAIALYRKKEWPECGGNVMPMGLDQITYDAVVNSGRGRGVPWTGKAVGAEKPNDVLGVARTALYLPHSKRQEAVKRAVAYRLSFLRGLSIFSDFGNGWTRRCVGMEAIGVKMVLEDMGLSEAQRKAELDKEAGVAKAKANASAGGAAATGTGAGGGATQATDPTAWDWSSILGIGCVTVVLGAAVTFLVYQAFKNYHRSSAYQAAANGDIGG